MFKIDHSRFIIKTRTIWFSEVPFDVNGFDAVSFHACAKDVCLEGFSKEPFTTLIIDLNQDLETIWKKMDKDSCRRSIDKAKKAGVITKINQGYDSFLKMCSDFRREKGLDDFSLNVEFMKKNGLLGSVEKLYIQSKKGDQKI